MALGHLPGLHLARERGYKNVMLETDSQVTIILLKKDGPWEILAKCRELLSRDWSVVLRHTFRKENMTTNWMTN